MTNPEERPPGKKRGEIPESISPGMFPANVCFTAVRLRRLRHPAAARVPAGFVKVRYASTMTPMDRRRRTMSVPASM